MPKKKPRKKKPFKIGCKSSAVFLNYVISKLGFNLKMIASLLELDINFLAKVSKAKRGLDMVHLYALSGIIQMPICVLMQKAGGSAPRTKEEKAFAKVMDELVRECHPEFFRKKKRR